MSEAAAERGEHGGVVAPALVEGGARADVGVQPEQLRAHAELQRAELVVALQSRHRVPVRAGDRQRAGEGFLREVLELAVDGGARVRMDVVAR